MKRMLFLFLAFMLSGPLRAQIARTVLVLRGGTLVDISSGKEISDSIIVIRGERIEQVGTVVLEADPLEEIQNLKKIHFVVQSGKTYAPDALLQQARLQANKKP